MWTGNLSSILSSGGPPGPQLQKINALLHEEPYQTIAYAVYWSCFLMIFPPVAGIAMMWIFLFEILRYYCFTSPKLPLWLQSSRCSRIEPKKLLASSSPVELAVLITGCDTGFGKELAIRLASQLGFTVFAGCYGKESCKEASFVDEPFIIPIHMDVTNQKHVDSAYEEVTKWLGLKKQRYFHALINNAGIGKMGYIDWCKMSDYEICMEGKLKSVTHVQTGRGFIILEYRTVFHFTTVLLLSSSLRSLCAFNNNDKSELLCPNPYNENFFTNLQTAGCRRF